MTTSREQLFDFFRDIGIEFSTIEHEPLHTVEESQALRGEIPGGHSKNLFLKCKKGKLWLVTALEDTQIDLKRLAKELKAGRFSFGKAELLYEILGVHPGSVTPFSLINDLEKQVNVILDADMMKLDLLNFHPLENTATTAISSSDLAKFIETIGHKPLIYDFSSPNHDENA